MVIKIDYFLTINVLLKHLNISYKCFTDQMRKTKA